LTKKSDHTGRFKYEIVGFVDNLAMGLWFGAPWRLSNGRALNLWRARPNRQYSGALVALSSE